MSSLIDQFFKWYNRHLVVNISVALGLFLLQLVHLAWLFLDVVLLKITGHGYFPLNDFWQTIIILVDYTEIPALISTGLIYINELRKGYNHKSLLYLALLMTQPIHIFWITDEFVVTTFTGHAAPVHIPAWLAWIAIGIDYLEVPVIVDTTKKLVAAMKHQDIQEAAKVLKK